MVNFEYGKRELQLIAQSMNSRANNLTPIIVKCDIPEEKRRLKNLQNELRALCYKTRLNLKTNYPSPEGNKNV